MAVLGLESNYAISLCLTAAEKQGRGSAIIILLKIPFNARVVKKAGILKLWFLFVAINRYRGGAILMVGDISMLIFSHP